MSNFVVSARKYRPQRFDEVVGQQHVSLTLKNALQSDHLAHAFLFCGPRGVGKTTCARILAKTLNCQNPTADFEPCNTCDNCVSFSQNASFNITELDAASNNSVEHIRALIEQVRFQPQQGKYKVFIIDEVHMLSQAAFNAFLKTLEEPPSYAIFILATTEKHKIIPTILSRCQIFDFKRIQTPDMVAHLADICEQEGIKADADALHIVAQKADGALRDALSIFDRIVSFSGKQISYEDVITNLNVLDYDYYFRVVDALLAEDIQQTLVIFDDIQRKGFDGDLFVTGLAEHLRNILVCKDEQTLSLLDASDSLRDRYQQQARLSGSDFILTTLNLANDCDLNYKLARNKRLHVEMTLIKMASIGRAFRIADQPLAAPATQEKKTPDANVSSPVANAADVPSVGIAPPSTSPGNTPQAPAATTTNQQANSSTELNKKAPPTTSIPIKEQANTMAKANLSSMLAQLKEEDKIKVETVDKLQLNEVQKAWDKYVASVERDSLRFQLQGVELSLEHMTITAKVSSILIESAIREEHDLTETLRQELKAPDLMLKVEVDASMRKEEVKVKPKTLNAREKYQMMVEQNPAVKELVKRFGLRPDE
ncbi:DNA polymerase III subunit gamma/tau [Lewinella sp. LCG006]|uniref:DNA polymerase III subunit gamma/tau n=1 Tax=Lewinella sp. LCG006 TaxID=3231911 RepID=UPI0034606F7E